MNRPKFATMNPVPLLITAGVWLTWGAKPAGTVLLTLVVVNVLALAIKEARKTRGR